MVNESGTNPPAGALAVFAASGLAVRNLPSGPEMITAGRIPASPVRPRLSAMEWRARRQERREKQRQANVTRALKMRSARLAAAVPVRRKEHLPALNIGCSGWFYWHWRGPFYPLTSPPGEWFAHYCQKFSTVELNAPFYSWPTINTVKNWARAAAKNHFVYTVKVCELITHVKRFVRTETLVRDFGFIADLLGPHMGCFLFQLPPSYKFSPARLKNILRQLDPARRNVVEFRHRSWWNPKVHAAFKKAGVIFCSCSAPKLPEELVVTAPEVYIRFHGLTKWYRHDYSPDDLALWVERIRTSGCRRVWAYFNNDRAAHAIRNATELASQLRSAFRRPAGQPLPRQPMIKNVIFDIDGTLLDSNDFHARAWVKAFAAHGKKVSFARVRRHMGKGADQLLPEFLDPPEIRKIGKELGKLSGEIFQRDYFAKVRPFPKVRMLLKKIRQRGARIALASSAGAAEVKQYEKVARIPDLVEQSTSADDAKKSKPSPDIFKSALKLLGNPRPDTVVVIGDTPYDALAARRAKLPVIGVECGGFSKRILQAHGCHSVYKDPADLLANIKIILGDHSAGQNSGK